MNMASTLRLAFAARSASQYGRIRTAHQYAPLLTTQSVRFFKTSLIPWEIKTVPCPALADSVTEGEISQWTKDEGDYVETDEVICVLETDKVDIEISSPHAGTLKKHLKGEGDSVEVGQDLFEIDTDGAPSEGGSPAPPKETPSTDTPKQDAPAATPAPAPAADKAEKKAPAPKKEAKKESKKETAAPASGVEYGETRVKMSRMRLRVAERLKEAQNTTAMLTTFNEIDMTNIMALRNQFKDDFLKKHNIKLGFMSAFLAASTNALKDQPVLNAVIEGNEIVYRDAIDISVAVASPKGLVVPVIRECNNKNYADLERAIAEMGEKARNGEIAIEDMAGGTFTVSNGGVFGSLMGTPIINPPQSAILGMHGTFPRPVAINGKVEIRPMMYVALTYDHRLVDGREAVTFLRKIKQGVEDPATLLLGI
ncbi:hypothetical protein SARC_11492 [Sphaeroforma arctica JP610]|uniref:dihydrolipoyllysine-residue succinyltransferase n=1 Tax=Sphaeroforma arctica JP610 TaxID=667725 RepID=A0A0L0FGW1_9EUKA|nr:hypothetical protein SARC_11492 [Sphaeroforma arctica JP610]KNC75995.1 hypothetical protein SARC_11492 [Sphaeroforma arctica JP610]|eukprot:XP_014149897.1 hypothetical protein SARC_11492 [Sphaeroforma arctica JP610]